MFSVRKRNDNKFFYLGKNKNLNMSLPKRTKVLKINFQNFQIFFLGKNVSGADCSRRSFKVKNAKSNISKTVKLS